MSAQDIAGAVAWPVMFVLLNVAALWAYREREVGLASVFMIASGGALLVAVYCIARLFGAHA